MMVSRGYGYFAGVFRKRFVYLYSYVSQLRVIEIPLKSQTNPGGSPIRIYYTWSYRCDIEITDGKQRAPDPT